MNCKLFFIAILTYSLAQGQDQADQPPHVWSFNANANLYFVPDEFFVSPVFTADRNKLHLEARYNYEDMETFSAWAGYNFSGGDELTFAITPMIGGVFGNTNGVAAGLEFDLSLSRFNLYSESEYLFHFSGNENNYFYNWSDLTFSPLDWFRFGLSMQRLRVYQTDLELVKGLLAGVALNNWQLTTYFFNIGTQEAYVVTTLSYGF